MKKKIIFLDVDGVLNDAHTKDNAPSGAVGVSYGKIMLVKKIIDSTGAKVVLSSDWRCCNRETDKDFRYLKGSLHLCGVEFYDFTPDISPSKRGLEILHWMGDKEIDSWVVIDDIEFGDFYRKEFNNHLVITDPSDGLTENDAMKAINILGEVLDE